MATFSKTFRGCVGKAVYPKKFEPGDECPPELEEAAKAADALGGKPGAAKKSDKDAE